MKDAGDQVRESRHRFWVHALEEQRVPLRVFALRLKARREPEADDLCQDLAVRILRLLPDPAGIECVTAYLIKTMRRLNITHWRRESRKQMESWEDENGNERAGTHRMVDAVAPTILENQALQKTLIQHGGPFTSCEEQLLRLHLQGYECKEIARRLGQDVRIVRADLNAVRAKIRYRLRRRCPHMLLDRES
jgi:DNA-directed RNA polymerase specialized sigma24 family protein